MSEPVSVGLALYKSATLAVKLKSLATRFGNTAAFIKERDEMFRGWTAETATKLHEFVHQERQALLLMGASLEEHERQLEEIADQPEVQVLAVLYADAAFRESLDERRLMLGHAAATIVDPSLTIAQRCRAEKVLRDLDPDDVLELDRVARVAGGIQRLSEGRGIFHFAEDRHRWAVVEQSPSVDALLSSECVRYVDGMWGGPVAVVTSRGRVLLHLLRSYIAPRRRPASGREIVPGERGEHAARESLTVDFQSAMIKAAALARATRFDLTKSIHLRDYRVQFDYSKPGLDQKNKEPQPITEPPHDKSTRLHLWPLLQEIIETLKSTAPAAIEVVELQGQGFGSVQINGPFDVMRWLAEDVDAWWT